TSPTLFDATKEMLAEEILRQFGPREEREGSDSPQEELAKALRSCSGGGRSQATTLILRDASEGAGLSSLLEYLVENVPDLRFLFVSLAPVHPISGRLISETIPPLADDEIKRVAEDVVPDLDFQDEHARQLRALINGGMSIDAAALLLSGL